VQTNQNDATLRSEEIGWTNEYCRVQHFGYKTRTCSTGGRWATVTNWGEWAELDGWYQGCGFTPYTARLNTIEEARAAGEKWVARGVFPQQEAA
jgi:hypothetical protein